MENKELILNALKKLRDDLYSDGWISANSKLTLKNIISHIENDDVINIKCESSVAYINFLEVLEKVDEKCDYSIQDVLSILNYLKNAETISELLN